MPDPSAPGTRRPAAVLLLRLAGATLLTAVAAIHGYLWQQGYSGIDLIGPAFLADTMLGALGAVLVLAAPRRWLPWVAAAGAALAAGTLAALLLSTTVGLFGFVESTAAQLWWESFWVELATVVVLLGLTVLSRRRPVPGRRPADGDIERPTAEAVAMTRHAT